MNGRNKDYQPVYAIVRVDRFQDESVPVEDRLTVKKVVWSEEEAASEVVRLNQLNSPQGAHYFYQRTRLETQVPMDEVQDGLSLALPS